MLRRPAKLQLAELSLKSRHAWEVWKDPKYVWVNYREIRGYSFKSRSLLMLLSHWSVNKFTPCKVFTTGWDEFQHQRESTDRADDLRRLELRKNETMK